MLAASSSSIQSIIVYNKFKSTCIIASTIFGMLIFFKICLGIGLIIYADKAQQRAGLRIAELESKNDNKNIRTPGTGLKQSKLDIVEELSSIERYTVYKGRVL